MIRRMYISSFKHCRKFLAQDKAMKLTQGSLSVSVVTDFLMKINREVKVLEKAPNIWIKARKSEFSSALEVSSNAVIFPGEHLGCLDRENIF